MKFELYSGNGCLQLRFRDVIITRTGIGAYAPAAPDMRLSRAGTVEIPGESYDLLRSFFEGCIEDPYNQARLDNFSTQAKLLFEEKLNGNGNE